MSSIEVRRFHRRDRDQLTGLVNAHAAAVVPGMGVSVATVLGQLEREPGESIVDPWVSERVTLVAEPGTRAETLGEEADDLITRALAAVGRLAAVHVRKRIPLGGGLIPKAAVAFAGTYVVGLGLEKINRNGEGLSKWERREAYAAALDTGKEVARSMAAVFTKRS